MNAMAKAAAGLFLTLALASCASVSVEDGTERVTQKMPEMIYVLDFSTAHGDFQVDRTGAELADFKKNLQLMLKTAMVGRPDRQARSRRGGDESGLGRAAKTPGSCAANSPPSSRAAACCAAPSASARAGPSWRRACRSTTWRKIPARRFLTFSTTGGSGAEPGAILALTTDPLELAIGGVSGAAHGLSEDTNRTAREITAKFSDYMYKRGWISEDQWIKPKHERATDTW